MLRKLDSGFLIVLCIVAVLAFVCQTDKCIRTGTFFPAPPGFFDLSERDLTAPVTAKATR